MVQDVRHIFDQDGERREDLDIVEIVDVELGAWVCLNASALAEH